MPAKKKSATFIARCENQVLVLDPPDVRRNHNGQVIETIPGTIVEFDRHFFNTEDSALADRLRDYSTFNLEFWEQGNAPDEPKPTVEDQLSKITKASVKGDRAAVEAALAVEDETHQRTVVLAAGREALNALAEDDESDAPGSKS